MLEKIIDSTNGYIDSMPKEKRKKYGQFFTGMETARYMAELFDIPADMKKISVLDAGAGSGILACAVIECLEKTDQIEKIEVTCYENDPNIYSLLEKNLRYMEKECKKDLKCILKKDNYITSQSFECDNALATEDDSVKYDIVISNPPYMKLSKDAPEVKATSGICYGTPNKYFIFAAMSLFNLKNEGEMVYIIPRSWTSGAYFKRFREYLLLQGKLLQIHLFRSRTKVFEKENILQEIIIIKVKKTENKPEFIKISSTSTSKDFANCNVLEIPYDLVVSGMEKYVYLVTTEKEVAVLKKINKYHKTLPEIGLRMKTGLTVDFRNKKCLRNVEEKGAIPLFYSQHIKQGKVEFPIQKENEYIVTDQKGLMQENKNYLFVKRFTAKEESRRLQCGIYLSKKFPQYKKISTQNKINFIDGILVEMSECLVYGLYVLFNSTIYDQYYRILNGSTQVNSTEINNMPIPEIEIIQELGRKLLQKKDFSVQSCDLLMEEYYG